MKIKTYFIQFENYQIQISEKKIKSIRLKIDSETLKLFCSVPKKFPIYEINIFLESRKFWIEEVINKFAEKKIDTNSILYFGKIYPLEKIISEKNKINFNGEKFLFNLKKESDYQNLLKKFHLNSLREFINKTKPIYEQKLNTEVLEIRYRKMKTRWGTCIPSKRKIWLNSELIKKNPNEIEYVLAHEMVHFFESGHGIAFKKKLTDIFPKWREIRKSLNK